MQSEFYLVEMFGTAPKQNLTENSYFKISTSNLEHNLFRFIALIFGGFLFVFACFGKYIVILCTFHNKL